MKQTILFLLSAFGCFAQDQAAPTWYGPTLPLTCIVGAIFTKSSPPSNLCYCPVANTWQCGSPVATGQITVILSGTCPIGFTEVAGLNGKTVIGTIAANGNVGTTGGSDSITPAGTVSAPNFAGNPLPNHTHIISGSVGAVSAGSVVPTASAALTTAPGAGQNTANNTHTHPALPAHTHPAGTLTDQLVSAGTPSGTNSVPSFTGTLFDNRSSFVRVIFCSKD